MTTNIDLSGEDLYAAATDTQIISVANTHQALKFGAVEFTTAWTHSADTGIFTCKLTARYFCVLEVYMQKTSAGAKTANIRALFNSVEIPKSHSGIDMITNDEISMFSSSFQFDGVEDQDLKIEVAGSATAVQVVPGPNPGSATNAISAKINICRRY